MQAIDNPALLSLMLLPLVAAAIGWLTNWIAVKMLFHPRNPRKLLGFFTIQGVFPKRQKVFAENLGQLVSRELISIQEVTSHIEQAATSEKSMAFIMEKLSALLTEKLPQAVPMLAMFVNPQVVQSILTPLQSDLKSLIGDLSRSISNSIEKDLDITKTVQDKVNNFSVEKLEDIVNGIMKRELREIEILGGVLGFLIGCLQAGLNYFLLS